MIHGVGEQPTAGVIPISILGEYEYWILQAKAQTAEKGLFSFIFIADGLFISEKSILIFKPIWAHHHIIGACIGHEKYWFSRNVLYIFTEPFTISRQLMSLDHISGAGPDGIWLLLRRKERHATIVRPACQNTPSVTRLHRSIWMLCAGCGIPGSMMHLHTIKKQGDFLIRRSFIAWITKESIFK